MKTKKTLTFSVRMAILHEELWLDNKGRWGPYGNRKRFSDRKGTAQSDAEEFVQKHFGPKFRGFGLFPNS